MATETELLAIHTKYRDDLLSRQGVHAVGIGVKMRGGELTDTLAIVCFVENKLGLAALDPDDAIPPQLDGVPTDVQESPMFEPCATDPTALRQPVRPMPGGVQLQVNQGFGTLGFIGNFNGIMVAVSNQHVLSPLAATVYQPATDKHWNIGTTNELVLSTDVDAGYVLLLSGASGQATIEYWNGSAYIAVPVAGSYTPTLRDLPYPVWKTGRTTGTTHGNVIALYLSGTRSDGWLFANQLGITTTNRDGSSFMDRGDSGSAIVDAQNRIVGLLWGGSPGPNGFGGASPIVSVLSQLGIQVAVGQNQRQPAVMAGFEALAARCGATARGKKIAAFLAAHVPEIRELVHHDRRVGAVWTRRRGQAICNQVAENIAVGAPPLPSTVIGARIDEVLDAFHKVLVKQGSPGLRAAADAIRDDFMDAIDRPCADIVG